MTSAPEENTVNPMRTTIAIMLTILIRPAFPHMSAFFLGLINER